MVNIDEIKITPDGRVSFNDAARYLGFSPKTLEQWRARCYGPLAYKIGGKLFYKYRELEEFVNKEVVDSIVRNLHKKAEILSVP